MGDSPPSSIGPLPLVIGVSGHTDLLPADLDALAASVHAILGAVKAAARHSQVHVLSALADGADQLVAEEALRLGLTLVAVLPMPMHDYAATLSSDVGRARLSDLWGKAAIRIELPWVDAEAKDEKAQYEQVGLVISRFSHLLIALWNGLSPYDPAADEATRRKQQGGTAHIVHLRTHGESRSEVYARSPVLPNSRNFLDPPNSGPTLRIAAPRAKTPGCVGAVGSLWQRADKEKQDGKKEHDKDGADEKGQRGDENNETVVDDPVAWAKRLLGVLGLVARVKALFAAADPDKTDGTTDSTLFRHLDDANAMLAKAAASASKRRAATAEQLLPTTDIASLGDSANAATALRATYASADEVAMCNQRHVHCGILVLVTALPFAVAVFETYAHALQNVWTIGLYVAIVSASFLYYKVGLDWGKRQNRHQDFRAMAEALRVQFFWALGAVPAGVSDYYLRKHRNELSWIAFALRGPGLEAMAVALRVRWPDLVEAHWIEPQLHYFAGDPSKPASAGGKAKWHERCERWAGRAYLAGVAIAVLLLLSEYAFPRGAKPPPYVEPEWRERVVDAGVILMGFAPALAAALTIFADKHAAKDHAHQYARMAGLFRRAKELLAGEGKRDPAMFAEVARELGIEALVENADWLLAHRDRRVEPIKGG